MLRVASRLSKATIENFVRTGFVNPDPNAPNFQYETGIFERLVEEYSKPRNIRGLLAPLPERTQDILIMRFGLDGQPSRDQREIARQIPVTEQYVGQVVARILRGFLRAEVARQIQAAQGLRHNFSIDYLDIPKRMSVLLRASGIYTIGQLIRITEAELLQIPSFTPDNLREVMEKLDSYGYHLRPSR